MKVNQSYVWAVFVAVLLVGWLISGQFGRAEGDRSAGEVAAEGEAAAVVSVRARTIEAQPRTAQLVLRGRSEAVRKVEIRAETSGRVVALPFERGARVVEGDVICELAVDARDQAVQEAEAVLAQRQLEFEGARELTQKGVRSEVQSAQQKAAFEAAQAALARARIELANTKIIAPFEGTLESRPVDIGDFMRTGDVCGTVVDMSPYLVVGQVSEQEVARLKVGDLARISLVTGETAEGRVRFLARTADPATRTFRMEVEVSEASDTVRDGVTAELNIPLDDVAAHRISPAILSLDEKGVMGVRIVDAESRVRFVPVEIVDRGTDGVWVSGLPRKVTVITVGQEYVGSGQEVRVELEPEGAGA
ncbi:MAG: efflux RND transporter periplasmic adaptor subunit [Alphaproteobacteria bacterium]|nr:efflux RND transporter periplasmic adaptor subunit [Alphaproteobacteria bacterium]